VERAFPPGQSLRADALALTQRLATKPDSASDYRGWIKRFRDGTVDLSSNAVFELGEVLNMRGALPGGGLTALWAERRHAAFFERLPQVDEPWRSFVCVPLCAETPEELVARLEASIPHEELRTRATYARLVREGIAKRNRYSAATRGELYQRTFLVLADPRISGHRSAARLRDTLSNLVKYREQALEQLAGSGDDTFGKPPGDAIAFALHVLDGKQLRYEARVFHAYRMLGDEWLAPRLDRRPGYLIPPLTKLVDAALSIVELTALFAPPNPTGGTTQNEHHP